MPDATRLEAFRLVGGPVFRFADERLTMVELAGHLSALEAEATLGIDSREYER